MPCLREVGPYNICLAVSGTVAETEKCKIPHKMKFELDLHIIE
jgi:hypothetical protein